MKIKCKDAKMICDKSQYKDCTTWQRIKLEFHLLFCKSCKKYSKDNVKLTKMIQSNLDNLPHYCPNQEQLFISEEKKQSMQEEIEDLYSKKF